MKHLTVITVTYNAASVLEKTILSVIGQTAFSQIEFILVDGGSKDDTLQIARQYESSFSRIVSEPDHGIYDAMNKGAKLANAPWIVFMNAGDSFYDEQTVASLHLESQQPNHLIFGDCVRVYSDGRQELRKANPFFRVRNHVPSIGICHQSIYLPTAWMQEHPYRWEEYPHCADFEQIHAFHHAGRSLQYVDRPLSLYSYGEGFSSSANSISKVFEENASIMNMRGSLLYYKQKFNLWLSSHK